MLPPPLARWNCFCLVASPLFPWKSSFPVYLGDKPWMEDIFYYLADLYCSLSLGTRLSLQWITESWRALWLDMERGEDYCTSEVQLWVWRAGGPSPHSRTANWTDLLISVLSLVLFSMLDLFGESICYVTEVTGTYNDAEIQLFSTNCFETLSLPVWLLSQSLVLFFLTYDPLGRYLESYANIGSLILPQFPSELAFKTKSSRTM